MWSYVPGTPRAESHHCVRRRRLFQLLNRGQQGEDGDFHTRLGLAKIGHLRVSPAPFPGSPFKSDRRKVNKRATHGVQR